MKEKLINLKEQYKKNPAWCWLLATVFFFPLLPEYVSPFLLFIGFIVFKVQWSKEGKKAKEIAGLLDISQNKVYYLLRKNKQGIKFDNYSKKHNHDEVKSLKEEGLKPKEIASKLDIPLRTVYYILNKK